VSGLGWALPSFAFFNGGRCFPSQPTPTFSMGVCAGESAQCTARLCACALKKKGMARKRAAAGPLSRSKAWPGRLLQRLPQVDGADDLGETDADWLG